MEPDCPIERLRPNPYNPNRQSAREHELLQKSILEDGFTQPIVCNQDYVIVDGEHRYRAAQALGFKTVPVVRVSMTEAQMRIATLRHNRARGSEDQELTARVLQQLADLNAADSAKESLMLSDSEFDRIASMARAADELAATDFSAAWTPATPVERSSSDQVRVSTAGKRKKGVAPIVVKLILEGDEAERVRKKFGDDPVPEILARLRAILNE